jgi:hypothetical protein
MAKEKVVEDKLVEDKLVEDRLIAGLLELIVTADKELIIENITDWIFKNNWRLLPGFLKVLSENDSDGDLITALNELYDNNEDWLTKIPNENSTAVMEILVNHLNIASIDKETRQTITHVLATFPQTAVDILNEKIADRDELIEMIKTIFDEFEDC